MTTTADVLRDAKALIAEPDHWVKGASSARRDGRLCFCTLGALWESEPDELEDVAVSAFIRANGLRDMDWVASWNDGETTTHADVMAAFDRAIAAEEST